MTVTGTTVWTFQADDGSSPAGSRLRRASPLRLPLLLALALLQAACNTPATVVSGIPVRAADPWFDVQGDLAEAYVETGDLDAIRRHGTLRVLIVAPRGAACDDQQRSAAERELLAAVRTTLDLKTVRVCVERDDELATALREGRGDLSLDRPATPVGDAIAFTLPRVVNRDWVLTREDDERVRGVDDLAGLRVAAVHDGAGWRRLQTWQTRHPGLLAVALPVPTSPVAVARGLADGDYDAVVGSSSDWQTDAVDGQPLRIAFDAGDARPLRWAVRADATQLLATLDHHLNSVPLAGGPAPLRQGDLAEIRSQRVLRVLVRRQPGSFFLEQGDLRGFEYDLLHRFAERQGVHLELVVPPPGANLIEWLRDGRGDIVGMPMQPGTLTAYPSVSSTHAYRTDHVMLVGSAGAGPLNAPDAPDALAGRRVAAIRDTAAWSRLIELRRGGSDVLPVAVAAETPIAQLLADVAAGRHALAAVAVPLPEAGRELSPGVTALLTLGEPTPRVWATRSDNLELLAELDAYIDEEYRGVEYNVLRQRYFGRPLALHTPPEGGGLPLSPYDDEVRALAADYGFDWRLIVAQMFQESRFDPEAISSTGARGLMQVMPATSREVGFDDLSRPGDAIHAGVKYLAQMRDRFERDLPANERLWFALAAYNSGYSRVRAARRLASELDLDPNRWFGHVERALAQLPRSKSRVARGHRGCRCGQPVHYVREIHALYAAYTHIGTPAGPERPAGGGLALRPADALERASSNG